MNPQNEIQNPSNGHKSCQSLFNLEGRVAIVTGGAGWLGQSICEALAELGARVAVVDMDAERLDAFVCSLKDRGFEATGKCTDAMDETCVQRLVDEVAIEFQRLDILVNCAHRGCACVLDGVSVDQMQRGFETASAYTVTAKHAAAHMRKLGAGSIINIGSMYGSVAGYPEVYEGLYDPNPLNYQACKAAIAQITRHLAVYYAKDGIRVNTLSPGPVPNPGTRAYAEDVSKFSEFVRRLESSTPMGRVGRPEEFKGPIAFLASDASSFVTGQNLFVDGGWTVW